MNFTYGGGDVACVTILIQKLVPGGNVMTTSHDCSCDWQP